MEQNLSLVVKQGEISVVNYDLLKAEIEEKVKKYQFLVISENELTDAKDDLANLRKLSKALNDERIAKEREYMTPWTNAKNQIDGLIKPIKEAIENIDTQVKTFEEQAKTAKREQITLLWSSKHFNLIPLEKLFNEKWLNKGYNENAISKEMDEIIKKINDDFATIEGLCGKDNEEAITEAFEIYKTGSLDVGQALTERKRRYEAREALKATRNAYVAPKPVETPKTVENEPLLSYSLKISGTRSQLEALKKFITDNGLTYEKL